jgi:hypothetical protein
MIYSPLWFWGHNVNRLYNIVYQAIGAALLGLISLGVFAKASDVEQVRAEMYANFSQKQEVAQRLDTLDGKIDDIKRILIERKTQ